MTNVVMRAFAVEDRERVRSFLTRAIGGTTNFDRYETNNPLGPPVRVIAEREGRIVGFNQWNAWLVRTRYEPIVVYQSGTSAVDPDCRGQQIFARLLAAGTREAEKCGVTAFIGFPNPLSKGSLVRDGWVHVKDLLLYVSLVPALGHRASPGELTGFAQWRYNDEIVRARVDDRVVLFVPERRKIRTLRVLDVFRHEVRDYTHLAALVRALPGPAVAYFRSSAKPSALMLHVRRRWDTPLLVKRICADATTLRAIHGATYVYGDIDAA
jgi:GNAT superfamily N-acetyltransferase